MELTLHGGSIAVTGRPVVAYTPRLRLRYALKDVFGIALRAPLIKTAALCTVGTVPTFSYHRFSLIDSIIKIKFCQRLF